MNTVCAAQTINSIPGYVTSWERLICSWNEFDLFISEMNKADYSELFSFTSNKG